MHQAALEPGDYTKTPTAALTAGGATIASFGGPKWPEWEAKKNAGNFVRVAGAKFTSGDSSFVTAVRRIAESDES